MASRPTFQIDPLLGGVVASYSGAGSLISHFTYGLGLMSQVSASGTAAYYDFNNIGSTIGITGPNGSYLNKYGYLPSGAALTVFATLPNTFQFVGQASVSQEAGGLYSIGARSYDAATGQFLSPDPLGLVGGATDLREYASNDPVDIIDPTGLTDYCFSQLGGFYGPGIADPGAFSGYGKAWMNNPGAEQIPFAGPTPAGWYTVGSPMADPHLTPPTFYLDPEPDTDTFGRNTPDNRLGIHGASKSHPGQSSEGCIILTPKVRRQLHPGDRIHVTPGPCTCQCPPSNPPMQPSKNGPHKDSPINAPGDPNNIIGPAGFGDQNFVTLNLALPYTIDFENEPTAGLPAQQVIVTQQLDSGLNWESFRLGSFGWGGRVFQVPANSAFYQTTST